MVASGGGTTTITSSPGLATPNAVRIAASLPCGVASAFKSCSSFRFRSSSAWYCRSTLRSSEIAICALPASPQMRVPSQNDARSRAPASSPSRSCLARMRTVYPRLLPARLDHFHEHLLRNLHAIALELSAEFLALFLLLEELVLAGNIAAIEVSCNILSHCGE